MTADAIIERFNTIKPLQAFDRDDVRILLAEIDRLKAALQRAEADSANADYAAHSHDS